jgi:hypothetical protein
MSQVTELADPKLKAIAKRVLRELQVEAEKAVAHDAEPNNFPLAADANSTERLLLSRLQELAPVKQQAAHLKALASVKLPQAQRVQLYGDVGKVNLKVATPVEAQVRAMPLPTELKVTMAHLKTLVASDKVLVPHAITAAAAGGGLVPQQTTDKLELRIHRVKCVDETNPEAFGDDEIAMGGLSVDETGETKVVSQFTVRNDFDDGEQKIYNPPKRFTWFNLKEGTTFPKGYAATIVLAEKDMGGFADFLNKLWDKVKGKVLEMAAAAVGAAVGSATLPGLGTLVGAAVGWVIAKFIEWLIGLFNDDVFKPFTVSVNIPSLSARWPGGKTDSPEGVINYSGYGGTYSVTFDWRLFA